MSRSLSVMMAELGLVDVWRHQHPTDKDFTFMSHVHGSYTRIDFFCMLKKELFRAKETTIQSITISDDSPVTLNIDMGMFDYFKHWRLNVSLLKNPQVKQEVQSALSEYFAINDDSSISPSIVWDASKATIRAKLISIGARMKKQRLAKQVELENEKEDWRRNINNKVKMTYLKS